MSTETERALKSVNGELKWRSNLLTHFPGLLSTFSLSGWNSPLVRPVNNVWDTHNQLTIELLYCYKMCASTSAPRLPTRFKCSGSFGQNVYNDEHMSDGTLPFRKYRPIRRMQVCDVTQRVVHVLVRGAATSGPRPPVALDWRTTIIFLFYIF